jgi:hypothetical protein
MEQDRRRADRIPDGLWVATLTRVRGEFDEMPCLRVTPDRARVLFGLESDEVSMLILSRLAGDGFLDQTSSGEYVRRKLTP